MRCNASSGADGRGGFYVPISMNIMHEQPRRTWPQNVPYLHLTGVDTEGGVVGPLRFGRNAC